MIDHCMAYAEAQRRAGHPVVGIMCEYAPRELIMAAGGVPVCLCGGDVDMIGPAEKVLPSMLCPLIKSTFGYHLEKANPFLEMADLIVAETTCDGKKKMFDLMSESRPTYALELPQKENDPDAFALWHRELHKFKSFLEARYRTRITEARLRAAARLLNRERRLRRALAELMKSDAPPLTGRELLDLKSIISAIPRDLDQYESALAFYRRRRPPAGLAARVRVLMTGVPMVHGAEHVLDIIETHGGLVVCQENCTGLKPVLDDVDTAASDILLALARKYYRLPCAVRTPNTARMDSLRRLARDYRPRCVIELVWTACTIYDVESDRVRRLVKEELGLPYLRIQTDYSPSDLARIALRVEALFETIRR